MYTYIYIYMYIHRERERDIHKPGKDHLRPDRRAWPVQGDLPRHSEMDGANGNIVAHGSNLRRT